MSGTRAISTKSRHELSSSFFSCKARRRRKFTPFWQKHSLLSFLVGLRTYQHPLRVISGFRHEVDGNSSLPGCSETKQQYERYVCTDISNCILEIHIWRKNVPIKIWLFLHHVSCVKNWLICFCATLGSVWFLEDGPLRVETLGDVHCHIKI